MSHPRTHNGVSGDATSSISLNEACSLLSLAKLFAQQDLPAATIKFQQWQDHVQSLLTNTRLANPALLRHAATGFYQQGKHYVQCNDNKAAKHSYAEAILFMIKLNTQFSLSTDLLQLEEIYHCWLAIFLEEESNEVDLAHGQALQTSLITYLSSLSTLEQENETRRSFSLFLAGLYCDQGEYFLKEGDVTQQMTFADAREFAMQTFQHGIEQVINMPSFAIDQEMYCTLYHCWSGLLNAWPLEVNESKVYSYATQLFSQFLAASEPASDNSMNATFSALMRLCQWVQDEFPRALPELKQLLRLIEVLRQHDCLPPSTLKNELSDLPEANAPQPAFMAYQSRLNTFLKKHDAVLSTVPSLAQMVSTQPSVVNHLVVRAAIVDKRLTAIETMLQRLENEVAAEDISQQMKENHLSVTSSEIARQAHESMGLFAANSPRAKSKRVADTLIASPSRKAREVTPPRFTNFNSPPGAPRKGGSPGWHK